MHKNENYFNDFISAFDLEVTTMKRVHVYISGELVQGISFRARINEKANELDVKGFVKNLDDGSVEAVFEGDESDVDELVEYCKEGPRGAQIDDVDILDEEVSEEFDDFEIRY